MNPALANLPELPALDAGPERQLCGGTNAYNTLPLVDVKMSVRRLRVWIREVRAPFLLLPTIFVPLGVAVAWVHGSFDLSTSILTFVAAICMHASVNVLNDYFDFRSGLDLATTPTPYSGGSRVLPERQLTPRSVLLGGIAFLGVGLAIGVYFLFRFAFSPVLMGIIAISSVAIVAYTTVLSRWGVGELVAGLNFGPLLILGTYFLQTGSLARTGSWKGTR